MTIEEKAKAYDEALKRAKAAIDIAADKDLVGGVVRTILPELVESKDERIIRAIIDALYSHTNSINLLSSRGYQMEDIEAWLEKQKEQNEELVYRLNGLMQDYIKEGKDDDEKEHRLKCYQLFWDALEDTNFFEQKEQKPVDYKAELKKCKDNPLYFYDKYVSIKQKSEWSEEDETCLENALWCVMKTRHFVAKDACDLDACRSAERWLKFLPERFNLQPKQEWSEKDEEHINSIFNDFKQGVIPDKEDQEWLKNRLKSIRPQPHTVSIKNATKFGNLEYERGVKDGIQNEKKHQWKPSKEQMEALARATNSFIEADVQKILVELLEQLEKL